MMTKDQILTEIRRAAHERGGHIGLAAFVAATGIKPQQMIGKYWSKWNDALAEAAVATSKFHRPRTEEATVLEAVAQLIERSGKWPTQAEFSLARQRDASFPSLKVIKCPWNGSGLELSVK